MAGCSGNAEATGHFQVDFPLMADRAQRAPTADAIRDRVLGLAKRFRADSVDGLRAEWELRVDGQVFAVRVGEHACTVEEGPGLSPHTTIWVDAPTWFAIDDGSLTGPQAFLDRRLRLSGNLDLAVRLQTLFRPYHRARRHSDLDEVEVVADGVSLSTYLVGKGTPVLLLHGLGGTKISWVPLLAPLAASPLTCPSPLRSYVSRSPLVRNPLIQKSP